MKRFRYVIGVLAVTALAACGDSNPSTGLPTSLPTTVPPSIATSVEQAVCDIRTQVLSIAGQLQASALPSPADVAAQLQDLRSQLEDQASTLETQGATPLAGQVRVVADAIGQLAGAVNGADPGTLATAASVVVAALGQIPGCASPSPSGSP